MKNSGSMRFLVLAIFLGLGTGWTQPTRAQLRTTVLMSGLTNPTHIAFLPDGKIYVLSKNGTIRLYDPATGATTTAATLVVSNVREDGLHSLVLDPNFAVNRRVFVLFGTLTPSPSIVVARYTVLASDNLDLTTRVNIISIPYTLTNTDEHNTGCLAFDLQGNLFIALADNTNNFFSGPTTGYSPRDPARPNYDAQRSAANSNDLRGKILRIHPEDNGTYTIPTGNLFPVGTAQTRPEIYVMGLRHPFRLTVDARTGWLYWAEPGPNATVDDPNQGPRGYDVVNIAKTPGNSGWPYCRGNNFCYNVYNYTTNVGGALYNPNALQNTSTNNTGLVNLPPARPALVWYAYNSTLPNTTFPIFGNGPPNTSMLGPVYYFDGSIANVNKIPLYYNQHLFIFDHSRSLVHAVQLDNTGAVVAVKRFWDQTTANPVMNPIDLKVGPDGAFYFLDWGSTGYPNNSGGGNLVRLDYIGPPDPVVSPRRIAGKGPESRLLAVGLNRIVRLPAGAVSADFFDLRGIRIWHWERVDFDRPFSLALPETLDGVLRMRIFFD